LFSPKERKKEEIRDEETPEWVMEAWDFLLRKEFGLTFFKKTKKPLHCKFLGWGRRARSDVREASLKQHSKFDEVRTHHARTIQDPALHLEMAHTMLVDHLSEIFQRLLSSVLCELCFLLRCHRLFELSEIPMRLCVKFLGVEWNMHIEINPFRFRFRSEAAANKVNF